MEKSVQKDQNLENRMTKPAPMVLRPTIGGSIGRKFDPETGTGFWNFK